MVPNVKSVELPSGVELPYIEQGDPSGVPVLFLHGYTDSWRSFEGVLPHLPGSIRALAVTQRGHGDAVRPLAGYHPGDFAADLAAFMDALSLARGIVAGHSMGGTIAQRFALDYPERTMGLVLIGAAADFRCNPSVVELWDGAVSKLTDPIDPKFVLDFQQSTLAQPISPAFLDTMVQESLKVPARVWRAALGALLESNISSEIHAIRAPTLIVWGEQDTIASQSDQEVLANGIAGAQLRIYGGTGHAVHWEEPERFASDLTSFVTGCRIGTPAPPFNTEIANERPRTAI
jgi:non-heme chloroperoxidase